MLQDAENQIGVFPGRTPSRKEINRLSKATNVTRKTKKVNTSQLKDNMESIKMI